MIVASFAVLGYYGGEAYRMAPPVPERVVTSGGKALFTGQDIKDGQNVWQSMGGQEVGSVWGHGAYVAPDWLNGEATWILDHWAHAEHGRPYDELTGEVQAGLKSRLKDEMRINTYNPETGGLVVSPMRVEAIRVVGQHYTALFSDDPELDKLRDAYAIPVNAITDSQRLAQLNNFLFVEFPGPVRRTGRERRSRPRTTGPPSP